MKTKVLVLFGPTASGKTALLEKLYSRLNVLEIVSADSMQVYRGMDIGTAKPSSMERAKIHHHLIDIRNPDEQFNAGDFVRLAEEACLAAAGRGALPVVSGGAGFYLKNLIMGLSGAPPSDPEIRKALKKELIERGAAPLMEELVRADPVSAGRIHINDEYRLLRALEVYRLSGKPLSRFSSPWNLPNSADSATPEGASAASERGLSTPRGASGPPFFFRGNFNFCIIGLRRSRADLYSRINDRTGVMFRLGLEDEVKGLFEAGYTPSDPGLRAIGYREFFVDETSGAAGGPRAGAAKSGGWRLSKDIAGVQALVDQNSRRYAKRQITFFASIPGVKWIDCEAGSAVPMAGVFDSIFATGFHGE